VSSLPLLDTITGGINNWLDAIRNDDRTLPGQIKADLNLLSAGAGAQTVFGQAAAYVAEGGTVGALAARIAPALEVFGGVAISADIAATFIGLGITYNKYQQDPTAANQKAWMDAVGKALLQTMVLAALLGLRLGMPIAAVGGGSRILSVEQEVGGSSPPNCTSQISDLQMWAAGGSVSLPSPAVEISARAFGRPAASSTSAVTLRQAKPIQAACAQLRSEAARVIQPDWWFAGRRQT
jgi:hypothetical protein